MTQKRSNLKHKPFCLTLLCLSAVQGTRTLQCIWDLLSEDFFLHSAPPQIPTALNTRNRQLPQGAESLPLSGNPLDTPIRRRGRADAWNFNQRENIEFVEFENVPLKQNAAQPSLIWKATTPPSLLHELNYFSCLYS